MTKRSRIHLTILTLIIILVAAFIAVPAYATGYVAYAHELPFAGNHRQTETHSLRMGYIANGMYIEAGPMTGGHSYEMGYKVKKGNWIFKAKLEGEETKYNDMFNNKIESEIIYTFRK